MIENKIELLGETIFYGKLDNGLLIYLIPNSDKKNYYVNLTTFYGSVDMEYKSIKSNKFVKNPAGIAHFLEHKVFEMSDGTNPFEFFSQSGTDVNAGTSYYATKFHLWGTNSFQDNFKYFLKMILNSNFTERNIIKERGIIEEEIKMYDDDPAWQLEDNTRYSLFHNYYAKEKIAGTIESIQEIDKEMLNDVYETFYQPNNMALVINGNFDKDYVIKTIHEEFSGLKKECKLIERKLIKEPESVRIKNQILKGNVIIPKLKYSFKIKMDNFSIKDSLIINLYLNCIFSSLFGATSDFYEKVYQQELSTGYYYEYTGHGDYYILSIEAETNKADLFKKLVDKVLSDIKVSEEELERHKRVWIANEIRMSERIDAFANGIIDDLIIYGKVHFNRIENIKSLNYKDLNLMIKELNLDNNTYILLLPKN